MPTAHENRRHFPLRPLLAGGLVLAAVLAVIHFRHILTATHDPGFSAPPSDTVTSSSQTVARPVVSAEGQFMTLDTSGKYLVNSITKKPVFITGDAAWSLITNLGDSDVEVYLSDRASRGFNYIWCAAADNNSQSNTSRN
jgi:uncharacterized protein DUF4038